MRTLLLYLIVGCLIQQITAQCHWQPPKYQESAMQIVAWPVALADAFFNSGVCER